MPCRVAGAREIGGAVLTVSWTSLDGAASADVESGYSRRVPSQTATGVEIWHVWYVWHVWHVWHVWQWRHGGGRRVR